MDVLTSEARDIGRYIRIKREDADISQYPDFPRRRRHVQHLTQGELAELVGVSTIVISQIEQARYPNVNASVLRRVARALKFTRQQELYLLGLLDVRPDEQVTEDLTPDWAQAYISQLSHPVILVNPVFDILSANHKARGLLESSTSQPLQGDNVIRLFFLEPAVRTLVPDFEDFGASVASGLKMFFAMSPSYRNRIEALGEEIAAQDETFRELWLLDNPITAATIEKVFVHPVLGEMKINQILSDLVEVPNLTKIDFLPGDDETRAKMIEL